MAKDDYNIIVYKIFAYLYAQLKAGADIDAAIISANGPLMEKTKQSLKDIKEITPRIKIA